MFVREPIVLCCSLLSGFSDALIFTFLAAFPLVYKQWGFTTELMATTFIPSVFCDILSGRGVCRGTVRSGRGSLGAMRCLVGLGRPASADQERRPAQVVSVRADGAGLRSATSSHGSSTSRRSRGRGAC
jgi:hypothetical protein